MVVTASAEENKDWYIGASAGLAKSDAGVTDLTGDLKLDESNMGYKVYAGYDVNKYISAEVFYADFGKVNLTGSNGTFKHDGATNTVTSAFEYGADITSFGTSAVFHLPLHKHVIPFAKIGVHRWKQSFSTSNLTGTDMQYGLGIDFPINDSFSIRTEYESYKFDSDNSQLMTAGLIVKF